MVPTASRGSRASVTDAAGQQQRGTMDTRGGQMAPRTHLYGLHFHHEPVHASVFDSAPPRMRRDSGAHPGTEYTPQCMKMPSFAPPNHAGATCLLRLRAVPSNLPTQEVSTQRWPSSVAGGHPLDEVSDFTRAGRRWARHRFSARWPACAALRRARWAAASARRRTDSASGLSPAMSPKNPGGRSASSATA